MYQVNAYAAFIPGRPQMRVRETFTAELYEAVKIALKSEAACAGCVDILRIIPGTLESPGETIHIERDTWDGILLEAEEKAKKTLGKKLYRLEDQSHISVGYWEVWASSCAEAFELCRDAEGKYTEVDFYEYDEDAVNIGNVVEVAL